MEVNLPSGGWLLGKGAVRPARYTPQDFTHERGPGEKGRERGRTITDSGVSDRSAQRTLFLGAVVDSTLAQHFQITSALLADAETASRGHGMHAMLEI